MQPRRLPSNPDAEHSVIGGLLFDGRVFDRVAGLLVPDDFYDARFAAIFDAVRELAQASRHVDVVTVAAEMKRLGTLPKLAATGGDGLLVELANTTCSTEGIARHAAIIREKSYLRRLIIEAGKVQDRAYQDEEPAEAIIEAAQANILGLADVTTKKEPLHIGQILHGAVRELERRQASPGAITGVPSGIEDLDELLGGAQPGHLLVMAGRPGMGKTALVLSWVMHAVEQRHPCLMFSIEMPNEELGMRVISGRGLVDNGNMRSGIMTSADWYRIAKANTAMAGTPLWIQDEGRQDLYTICSTARRWKRNKKAFPTGAEKGMVIVDYLQLIEAAARKGPQSREREVAMLSGGLKALAKELNMPVLALSSLNRECDKRPDKRPLMSDLKDSGSIEADANVVMLVYRDEVYNKEPKKGEVYVDNKGVAEICVGKNRGGPTGTVTCEYVKQFTLFRSSGRR